MLHKNVRLLFYFIRHAETTANIGPELVRGRCPEALLTKRGVAQARALGQRLHSEGVRFDRIYSSSLVRAVRTAEEMCAEMGVAGDTIVKVDQIVEFSQGAWAGKSRTEVYTLQNLAYIESKGYLFVPPGGESQRMVERRVAAWLEDEVLYDPEILGSEKPHCIAVVAHGLVLRCLLHYIMGFSNRLIWRIQLDNCSISRFLFKKQGWFPLCINDSAHLREIGRVPGLHTGE
jgi:broad specificity phosphatase PhoE